MVEVVELLFRHVYAHDVLWMREPIARVERGGRHPLGIVTIGSGHGDHCTVLTGVIRPMALSRRNLTSRLQGCLQS